MNGKNTTELEQKDEFEENYMTVYVETISGKTIRIKCNKKQKADTVSKNIEMRTTIPRGITFLSHQGKMLKNKNTIEESNIEVESTIEMFLRLLGGMDESDMKDSSETKERKRKKRKLEETSEGKSTRTSEESMFLQREIIDAIIRLDEKMENLLKKSQRKYGQVSQKNGKNTRRKADEKMDKFLQTVKDSVGTQLHGMNTTIAKMKREMCKEKRRTQESP